MGFVARRRDRPSEPASLVRIEEILDQSETYPLVGGVYLMGWDGAIYRRVLVDTSGNVRVVVA